MRYLGNKSNIIQDIENLLNKKKLLGKNLVLFDGFCGTGSVADYLKNDFRLIINDNLRFAVTYSKGRLYGPLCTFDKLKIDPFEYLNNNQSMLYGFNFKNYSLAESSRMYFTEENAARIDYFRFQIEDWKSKNLIDDKEYAYLLACLIESVSKVSNIAGVYGAFLKKWDARALKPIVFEKVESKGCLSIDVIDYNAKLEDIIENIDCDILYLDPPYTQNQYGTQYHLLETLILNDNPSISKVTGSRPTREMRSDWSKKYKANIMLDKVLAKTKAKHIILSYNNDGLMSKSFIEASLKRYGNPETYECIKIAYKKYKNWKSENDKEHFEYLFYIQMKPKEKIIYESPLNYIGSKTKIVPDIIRYSPLKYDKFIDAFGGGFNVGINMRSNEVVYNDVNFFVKDIIKSFLEKDTYDYLKTIDKYIRKFELKKGDVDSYNKAREYYNSIDVNKRDSILLFTLILYGFQQQIRFNNNKEFNNPSGIRWFNDKILEKLISFSRKIKEETCSFRNLNYIEFETMLTAGNFIYLDPPYMLTNASYNDGKRGFLGWNKTLEKEMFQFLERISSKNINFMLSYVIEHRGLKNNDLVDWIRINKFSLIILDDIRGISGKIRKEVLVINYDI